MIIFIIFYARVTAWQKLKKNVWVSAAECHAIESRVSSGSFACRRWRLHVMWTHTHRRVYALIKAARRVHITGPASWRSREKYSNIFSSLSFGRVRVKTDKKRIPFSSRSHRENSLAALSASYASGKAVHAAAREVHRASAREARCTSRAPRAFEYAIHRSARN